MVGFLVFEGSRFCNRQPVSAVRSVVRVQSAVHDRVRVAGTQERCKKIVLLLFLSAPKLIEAPLRVKEKAEPEVSIDTSETKTKKPCCCFSTPQNTPRSAQKVYFHFGALQDIVLYRPTTKPSRTLALRTVFPLHFHFL